MSEAETPSYIDEDDLTARTVNTSGTQVNFDDGENIHQRLRIYVPSADAELVLGNNDDGHYGIRAKTVASVDRDGWSIGAASKQGVMAQSSLSMGVNERGYVGILGLSDHGNIYLSATGAADLGASYADAQRAQIVLETALGIVRTGLLLWGATYQSESVAGLTALINVAQTAWAGFNAVISPMSGTKSGGISNMDYLQTGHVGLFGARGVKIDSIEGISSSAALYNAQTAGISASMSSIISASVSSGLLASVTGAYSASLNADTASVTGAREAKLSSRTGTAVVEGNSIRIGNRRLAGKWQKRLSGAQEQTHDLWMRANGFAELAVPSRREPPFSLADNFVDGHLVGMRLQPTGIQIMPGWVRTNSDHASLKLGHEVTSLGGKSLIRAGVNAVELGRLRAAPTPITNLTLTLARQAYATALGATEGLKKQAEIIFSYGWKVTAGIAVGAAGAVAAGTMGGVEGGRDAGRRAATGGNEDKGAWVGETVGGIIGGVTTALAVGLVAMRLAGGVQKQMRALAQRTYEGAVRGALLAEAPFTILDPAAAKVVVKDDQITLAVGTSQIKITPTAIEIKALKVTVNDVETGPGMVPAIPGPPIVPAPDSIPPPPPPGPPPEADP